METIHNITNIKNKLYIGKVIYNGKSKTECFEVDGQHEAIIDNETFINVQELISTKECFKAKKYPNEYSYFSPYLICSVCGNKFKSKQTKAKDKDSIRYYCTTKYCSCNSIKHIELENIFLNQLNELNLDYCENTINSLLQNKEYEQSKKALDTLLKKQQNIDEMFNCDNIKPEDYNRQMIKINDKISLVNIRILESEKKVIYLDDNLKESIQGLISSVRENFINLINTEKQNFINLFVDSIAIENISGKIIIDNLNWKYKNQCS